MGYGPQRPDPFAGEEEEEDTEEEDSEKEDSEKEDSEKEDSDHKAEEDNSTFKKQ